MPFQMKQFSQISCGFMPVFTIWKQKIEKKELTWQRLYTVHEGLVFAPTWSLAHQNN